MGQLELVIGRTSLEDNVAKITETIALVLDRKKEMTTMSNIEPISDIS